jgi:hypothetical protein
LRRVLAAARPPLSIRALASATAVLKLERFIVDGRAASATNPPVTLVATKGAADTLRSSVSRVIGPRPSTRREALQRRLNSKSYARPTPTQRLDSSCRKRGLNL